MNTLVRIPRALWVESLIMVDGGRECDAVQPPRIGDIGSISYFR